MTFTLTTTILSTNRGTTPLIFSIPHSGDYYPDDLRQVSPLTEAELRSSEDAFVDQLVAQAQLLGATVIKANYARAYVDLNRAPDELDARLFDGPVQMPIKRSATVQAGLGVIPRNVGKNRAIYTRRLPAEQAKERLEKAYFPYHDALQQEIDRLWAEFGFVYILDCHSMPSIPNRKPKKGGKNRLPRLADIVLGDRWGTSCNANYTVVLEDAAIEAGFITARNHPYAGGYITRHYADPLHDINVLQLEICRDLYMNEQSIELNDGFEETKNRLSHMLEKLALFVQNQVPNQMAAE